MKKPARSLKSLPSVEEEDVDERNEAQRQHVVETTEFLNTDTSGVTNETDAENAKEIDEMLRKMPLSKDTTCGLWCLKGAFFQKFANPTAFVVVYGLVGCLFAMTHAYFNGTLTTMEKRFKIASKNMGIISIGNDISQLVFSAVLGYYAGGKHRPRWISFGLMTVVIYCLMTAAPHFIYGAGEDALALTVELGGLNVSTTILETERTKSLCRPDIESNECKTIEGNFTPQVLLFIAKIISGIGSSLFFTLGIAYMDDNSKKSQTPTLFSISYFLNFLGPPAGYALSSFCLRIFISPELHPVITESDPRWLGAWWIGWVVIGLLLTASSILFSMFPKELPRAVARRAVAEQKLKKRALYEKVNIKDIPPGVDEVDDNSAQKASFNDMLQTFKRLLKNKIYVLNTCSSIFFIFGMMPYWMYTPKYIETQYRQSAATSSLVMGTVALVFTAIGILLSGIVLSKLRPRARSMAAWNAFVGILTVTGMISYAFIGCPGVEKTIVVSMPSSNDISNATSCNANCHCDYVRYTPVCGENEMTYVSPCHAGCKTQNYDSNGKTIYTDCSCISKLESFTTDLIAQHSNSTTKNDSNSNAIITQLTSNKNFKFGGEANEGACPVNCFNQFVTFLAVMCTLKFFGSTGRAANFLLSLRCVAEKDKSTSLGFGMTIISILSFIPSPIFFGWIFDQVCLVWGKTCTNKGNCWLYDSESLRYLLNFTAAGFVLIAVFFEFAVWYYVKDLKVFDEDKNDKHSTLEEELQVFKMEKEKEADNST